MANDFSVKQAIHTGWRGATQHFLFFVGMLFLVFFVTLGFELVLASLEASLILPFAPLVLLVVLLVDVAVQWLLSLGMVKIALTVADEKKPAIKMLFSQYRVLGRFAVAAIVYTVIVLIGTLFLIAPGIWLGLKFHLFPYAIVDKNVSWRESLAFSNKITMGYKWRLLGFYLLVGLINVVGALALGVGLLLTIPLVMVANAAVYRALAGRVQAAAA